MCPASRLLAALARVCSAARRNGTAGDGAPPQPRSTRLLLLTLSQQGSSCVLLNGELKCWGSNVYGQVFGALPAASQPSNAGAIFILVFLVWATGSLSQRPKPLLQLAPASPQASSPESLFRECSLENVPSLHVEGSNTTATSLLLKVNVTSIAWCSPFTFFFTGICTRANACFIMCLLAAALWLCRELLRCVKALRAVRCCIFKFPAAIAFFVPTTHAPPPSPPRLHLRRCNRWLQRHVRHNVVGRRSQRCNCFLPHLSAWVFAFCSGPRPPPESPNPTENCWHCVLVLWREVKSRLYAL